MCSTAPYLNSLPPSLFPRPPQVPPSKVSAALASPSCGPPQSGTYNSGGCQTRTCAQRCSARVQTDRRGTYQCVFHLTVLHSFLHRAGGPKAKRRPRTRAQSASSKSSFPTIMAASVPSIGLQRRVVVRLQIWGLQWSHGGESSGCSLRVVGDSEERARGACWGGVGHGTLVRCQVRSSCSNRLRVVFSVLESPPSLSSPPLQVSAILARSASSVRPRFPAK